ncbi:hypothetical protein CL618_00685 [archaeon]|nr:hypothetical protein [archaeon]|tara:strand:- start:1674 stop:2138 length:465 start_codon:yes stop_codon:yes gene_type:complete
MIDIVRFDDKGYGKKLGFKKVYFKDLKIEDGERKNFENKNVDVITGLEKEKRADHMKYRSSGLNHILCKIAKENKISIGFSFNDVLKSKGMLRGQILGRMMQNVRICRKYKVKMIVFSFAENKKEMRDVKDLISFGRVIGMTPGEAKRALEFKK